MSKPSLKACDRCGAQEGTPSMDRPDWCCRWNTEMEVQCIDYRETIRELRLELHSERGLRTVLMKALKAAVAWADTEKVRQGCDDVDWAEDARKAIKAIKAIKAKAKGK